MLPVFAPKLAPAAAALSVPLADIIWVDDAVALYDDTTAKGFTVALALEDEAMDDEEEDGGAVVDELEGATQTDEDEGGVQVVVGGGGGDHVEDGGDQVDDGGVHVVVGATHCEVVVVGAGAGCHCQLCITVDQLKAW